VVGVDRSLYMKSTSGNDGSYTLTVSFALGTDPDINTVNVNNRVQTALSQLPPEVQQQGLVVQKKSSAILQFIVLYSANGEQDPLFITNYAIINVLDAISRTPGVGQASLFAKLNYSMRIWFDSQRLTSLNLAPSDVIAAIRAQSVQAPVGRIGARPISDQQQFQFNVQTQGRLTTPAQFGNIVLRANPDGSVLRISDVARVEIGAQNLDSESRIDGRAGVPIGIYLAPGANAVDDGESGAGDAAKAVGAVSGGPDLSGAVRFHHFCERHHHRGAEDARRSLRAGGDRGVSVPRQPARHRDPGDCRSGQPDRRLCGAAGARLFGQHGVTAGDGARDRHRRRRRHRRVENVERVMEEEPDATPAEATKKAMAQITAPIIAITLVLLSVFVPIAFIPGISGTLFRQFAVTISAAMVISALNALTLSPALCAVFLRHTGPRRGILGRVLGGIDWVRDRYASGVRRLVRMAALSLVLVLVFAGGIFGVSLLTPTGLPAGRRSGCLLHLGAIARRRVGSTHQRGNQAGRKPAEADACGRAHAFDHRLFAARRGIRTEQRLHGGAVEAVRGPQGGGGFGAGVDPAHVRRGLANPAGQRAAVQSAADHRAFDQRRLRVSARGAGGAGPGCDGQRRRRVDRRPPIATRGSRACSRPSPATNPSIYLDIDRAKAQALGLNISDVFTALQATLGGIYVNNFNLYGRTWQVNVQGEASDRGDISDIWQIYVRNSAGAMVPIRSVAGAKIVTGPQVITRYNNYRSVTVNGSPAPGISSGTALAAMTEISNATLPAGYSYEWTGNRLSRAAGVRPDRHHSLFGGTVRLSVPGCAL